MCSAGVCSFGQNISSPMEVLVSPKHLCLGSKFKGTLFRTLKLLLMERGAVHYLWSPPSQPLQFGFHPAERWFPPEGPDFCVHWVIKPQVGMENLGEPGLGSTLAVCIVRACSNNLLNVLTDIVIDVLAGLLATVVSDLHVGIVGPY